MKAPTPLQQRAWDMQQAGMSLADIAAAEGITIDGIVVRLRAYRRKTNTPRSYGTGVAAQKAARLRELERLTAEQAERIEALTENAATMRPIHARLARLEAKLDELLARPLVAPVVSHRRVADGGTGGRQEMKALRRVA